MCWWSTGVDGMNAPTIAATCGAQIPAALTTSSVSIGPASVRTAVISRRADSSNPVTRTPVRIRTPSARAASATACVAPCGSRWPSPARWTAPYSESGRDRRHQAARLVGADHLDVEPDPARPAGGPLELAELVAARGEPQAADGLEDAEALVQLDAVAPEGHHRRRRVERGHESGRLAGRPGGQLRLLDEQHVGPAGQREVVGDAAAGDPATDDDDACLVRAHGGPRYAQWQRRAPGRRPVSPDVGMNDHSYEVGWRTNRITPWLAARRSFAVSRPTRREVAQDRPTGPDDELGACLVRRPRVRPDPVGANSVRSRGRAR